MGLPMGFRLLRSANLLQSCTTDVLKTNKLDSGKWGVDVSVLLHAIFGTCYPYLMDGYADDGLTLLVKYFKQLTVYGLEPIAVFDGILTKEKETTNDSRDNKRNIARDRFKILYSSWIRGIWPGEEDIPALDILDTHTIDELDEIDKDNLLTSNITKCAKEAFVITGDLINACVRRLKANDIKCCISNGEADTYIAQLYKTKKIVGVTL